MELSTPTTNETDPRDQKRFYYHATPLRKFLVNFARALFVPLMDMQVSGLENFPLEGAAIVAANHVTNFDIFPMQFSLPRPIFYMGKEQLFRNPFTDALFRNMGAFPVSRDKKDQWAYNHALKVLAHQQTLGMFPEGTRSRGHGLSVARTGVARLSIQMNSPIIPMAIVGSDKFFRRDLATQRLYLRTHVTVNLLTPILPRPEETAIALTDRVMFSLAAALPPEMRGVYADVPKGFGD